MYDRHRKAVRDHNWMLNAAREEGLEEGEIKGEVKMIRMLQGLLSMPLGDENELSAMSLAQLETLTAGLQEKLRGRAPA